VAVDLAASRRAAALALGATQAVAPDDLKAVGKAIHQGHGFDYAFEAVGSPVTMRSAYDNVRRGGTAVVLGIGSADQKVEFSSFEFAWTAKRFVGSTYGSGDVRRDFPRLLQLWRTGRLDLDALITQRYKITEVNDALRAMRDAEGIRQVVQFV
jgi:S-(hydroxymethyl)glutathione dehydrogenase/alcohol dehydrogenase